MRRASAHTNPPVQTSQVEKWINQRTWGRLRNLGVEREGGRVIVHGHAGSYYHKQLALAAAMEKKASESLKQLKNGSTGTVGSPDKPDIP